MVTFAAEAGSGPRVIDDHIPMNMVCSTRRLRIWSPLTVKRQEGWTLTNGSGVARHPSHDNVKIPGDHNGVLVRDVSPRPDGVNVIRRALRSACQIENVEIDLIYVGLRVLDKSDGTRL